jgi:hypothetical protein
MSDVFLVLMLLLWMTIRGKPRSHIANAVGYQHTRTLHEYIFGREYTRHYIIILRIFTTIIVGSFLVTTLDDTKRSMYDGFIMRRVLACLERLTSSDVSLKHLDIDSALTLNDNIKNAGLALAERVY